MAEQSPITAGVVAMFDDPDTVLHAAEKTRDAGYKQWDVFTPFPVHGMDDAMGLGRSKLPWITFGAALAGLATGVGIQVFTMTMSWPQNYGGKPFMALPAFIPISFETTVFFAGIASAVAALALGGVLNPKKRTIDPRITVNRFAIFVDAKDPKFDEKASQALFQKLGATEVRLLKEDK